MPKVDSFSFTSEGILFRGKVHGSDVENAFQKIHAFADLTSGPMPEVLHVIYIEVFVYLASGD